MEQYKQKVTSNRALALRWLAIITGLMVYLPVYLALSKDYLVRGSPDYIKDLILFVVSVIMVLISLFIWRAIYKQFKKDRTLLGFSPDKNGASLVTEILIEAVVSFLAIYLSSSKLFL